MLYNQIRQNYKFNVQDVKRKIEKSGFFEYLFIENRKIFSWNKNDKLLSFSFFRINIYLSENFKKRFDELFLYNVFPLSKYLKEIINNGWKQNVLTIREYNLIVLFYDFSSKMGIIQAKPLIIVNDFYVIEDVFLRLIVNKFNTNDLINGLDKILKLYKNQFFSGNEAVVDGLLKNLEAFFINNALSPSFYSLILAFNIMRSKRFIQWEEIVEHSSDDTVQSGFYNCTPEIFDQMIKYINNILNDIHINENEKKRIEWIRDLAFIKDNKPDKIIYYYEGILNLSWDKDSDDVLLMLLILIKGINANLDSLVLKELLLMNDKEEIIQKKIFFNLEPEQYCGRIFEEFIHAKEKHLGISPPKIALKNFLMHSDPEDIMDSNQRFIFERINNIFYYFRQIASLMNDILSKDKSDINTLMILKPVEWRKKIASNVIRFYIELFIQICSFFKEKNLTLELKKISKIDNNLELSKFKLNSVMDKNGILPDLINKEKTV